MKTKYIFLLLAFFLMSVTSFAQDCKYAQNKIDEFTKQRVIQTAPQTVVNNRPNSLIFSIIEVDNSLFLDMYYQTLSTERHKGFCFADGATISFLMMNGDVVTLPYAGNIECNQSRFTYGGYGSGIFTSSIDGKFKLSADQLANLQTAINKVRINFAEGSIDLPVLYNLENNKLMMAKIQGNKKMNPQLFFKQFGRCVEPVQVARK